MFYCGYNMGLSYLHIIGFCFLIIYSFHPSIHQQFPNIFWCWGSTFADQVLACLSVQPALVIGEHNRAVPSIVHLSLNKQVNGTEVQQLIQLKLLQPPTSSVP